MFLVYTFIAWISIAAIAKVLYISIQPEQWLDKLLHWQDKLHHWGTQTGFWNEYRYKSWGGCSVCFSRFVAFYGFWAYLFMAVFLGDCWLHTGHLWSDILANIIWYISFCSVSTIFNIFVINYDISGTHTGQ